MRAPAFWDACPPDWRARLLTPLGRLYGAATLARMLRPGAKAGLPVICVGNFTAGGAGKTPTAIALAARLAARGERPFVLMRGHGGRLRGPVAVDPSRHDAADVGDEPLLMAGHAPTVIARDRPAGAALARALGASVIVMDDGLQNPSLAKDLRLAVVDGGSGVGNGLCLPAGPLRAPLGGQMAAVDAVLVIGAGAPGDAVAEAARAGGRIVPRARLAPDPEAAARLAGRGVLALSGIGRPEKFAATLRALGAAIVAERAFGDHHAYTQADVASVMAEAAGRDVLIATTEKDFTKLAPLWPAQARDSLVVLPVSLVFDDPAAIDALLTAALAREAGASAPAGAAQA